MISHVPHAAGAAESLSRRAFLQASLAAPLLATGCGGGISRRPGDTRPNIVVIILDALRAASLPMYGCPRNTAPHLAELCSRATLFERCYSATSWTRPSIASILSGLPPLEHGVVRGTSAVPPSLPTFSLVLAEAGYRTGFFTAQYLTSGDYGMWEHFEHVSDKATTGRDGKLLIKECEAWLRNVGGAPACAFLHFFEPHGPYKPPDEDVRQLLAVPPERRATLDGLLPQARDVDIGMWHLSLGRIPWYQAKDVMSTDPLRYINLYEGFIRQADRLAAEAIARWTARRPEERTIFFITADHGECLGEGGCFFAHAPSMRDPVLHVPLIVYDTADQTARRVSSPVSLLNLAATITQLAEAPEDLGGWGFTLPTAGAELEERERAQVSQRVWSRDGEMITAWAITKGRWRLLFEPEPACGNGHTLRVVCSNKSREMSRYPLPAPATALSSSYPLAEGVTVETLGVHTPYVESSRAYGFSGRVRVTDQYGTFVLRMRVPGQPAVELGRFTCDPGVVELSGTLPALAAGKEAGLSIPILLEGRWETRGGNPDAAPGWRRLLVFPLHTPQKLNDHFELIGAVLESPVVRPGESFQMQFVWRCLEKADRDMVVYVHFLDDRGEIVINEPHQFFKRLYDKKGSALQAKQVPEGLRFAETFWTTVPGDLTPGEYSMRVGMYDAEVAAKSGNQVFQTVGRPVEAATLTVVSDAAEAVEVLAQRQESLAHVRAFTTASLDYERVATRIRELDESHRDEGHFSYLLAQATEGPQRARHLEACLSRVPFHLAALRELAALQPGSALTSPLELLTPPRECDFRLQGLLRLYGFDLQRSAEGRMLYLTVFWEALARMSHVYGLSVTASVGKVKKKEKIGSFIGRNRKPTQTLRMGEALAETVFVRLPSEGESVTLTLSIYAPWQRFYCGSRNRHGLESRRPGRKPRAIVDLGSFELEALPVATQDLYQNRWNDRDHYLLYDLVADPSETTNLVDVRPEVFEPLRREMLAMVARGKNRFEPVDRTMPEKERRQLKALGYLD